MIFQLINLPPTVQIKTPHHSLLGTSRLDAGISVTDAALRTHTPTRTAAISVPLHRFQRTASTQGIDQTISKIGILCGKSIEISVGEGVYGRASGAMHHGYDPAAVSLFTEAW